MGVAESSKAVKHRVTSALSGQSWPDNLRYEEKPNKVSIRAESNAGSQRYRQDRNWWSTVADTQRAQSSRTSLRTLKPELLTRIAAPIAVSLQQVAVAAKAQLLRVKSVGPLCD